MLNLHVLAVGGLRESWMSAACAEYQKRVNGQFGLRITELDEYRLPSSPSAAQINIGLQREAAAIRKKIPARAFTVALCVEGTQLSSPDFARIIERAAVQNPAVAFLIGSSYGLDESLKCEANYRLSISAMTFPHQLARVILFEQLYRCTQIINGGQYHK